MFNTENTEDGLNRISRAVIGCAIEVHPFLGPGLLESAYESCLEHELVAKGHKVERQREVSVVYRGLRLACGYRLDMVVDDIVIVEVKSVEHLLCIHSAQLKPTKPSSVSSVCKPTPVCKPTNQGE